MSRPSIPRLTLRPATAEDAPFLRALYAETRAAEMAAAGWPETFQASFLQGQFNAQQSSYRREFPDASFDVVLARNKPVGRLYVARRPEAITVVEITLTTACRGHGWGTALLKIVLGEADRAGLPVRLHVDANNRAQRLYRRLGFLETGRAGFYLCLERPLGGKNSHTDFQDS